MAVHQKTGEPPQERLYSEVINMCTYDKYRMIRMDGQLQEIDEAVEEAKGKPGLTFRNFLPR
jgi:hypothetical protein